MQINETRKHRILHPQKLLKTNRISHLTHQLKNFIATFSKKALLIMYAAFLTVIMTGCGGGGISVSSISFGQKNDPGNTNISGDTGVTGDSADATGFIGGITGSAKLAWGAPTTNTDGTPLTDLAGYKIYYGTSPGNYTSVVDAGNVTIYTINHLSPGTYYFAVTSYDISGIESDYSNEASKTIQ